MILQTTRFGDVEIDESRIMHFPAGLLGFSSHTRYVLLQPEEDAVFFWLQCVDTPDLAFVITDPSIWTPEYEAPVRQDQMDELELADFDDAQVFVIVNKHGDELTANYQGPLLVNTVTRRGTQLVLADKRWTTRHALLRLNASASAASA